MRNALLETFILVMKHFLMMSQDFLSHYYYIYASSFMIARNINPTLFDLSGKKSPCATKRTRLYYGQQESRMVGTCVSDKI